MKTLLLILAACACSAAPLRAQVQTLFGTDPDFGGYGGPTVQVSPIAGELGLLVGGGGGVIVDHVFSLGGAGYGLVNNISIAGAPSGQPYLNLGYGGVYLQYIHASDDLLHVTGTVLIGGGDVSYRSNALDDPFDDMDDNDSTHDAFFVVEPNAEMELNVTRHIRIAAGFGYRIVSGITLQGLDNGDISGPNVRLMLKFGSF